jgi:hypothetical protein
MKESHTFSVVFADKNMYMEFLLQKIPHHFHARIDR